MSERFTITLPDDMDERLPYDEHDSKSATVVHFIRRGFEADELGAELESAEAQVDDLRRQLQATNRRQDDMSELVEYVEQEKSLQERREERRGAPIWTRAKRWVFGRE